MDKCIERGADQEELYRFPCHHLFSNSPFTLNNPRLLDMLFATYRRRFYQANDKTGLRILAIFGPAATEGQ